VKNLEEKVAAAVRHFWITRLQQHERQAEQGKKDQGSRGAVTGGAQLDGFIELISNALLELGLPPSSIIRKKNVVLPGFYRPTKEWDLLVIIENELIATIEFKSQVGPSFGNNFNNRTEEAIGSAVDLWTAYREGAFSPSSRPWLGYFMLLEETERSIQPVSVNEPHFQVFPEFQSASYARRYEIFCGKLVRERLYDSAWFLMSNREEGVKGEFTHPSSELSFARFITSLSARVIAHLQTKR
jgi:hypothetical protein